MSATPNLNDQLLFRPNTNQRCQAILPGEAWTDAALADIHSMPPDRRQAWIFLLGTAASAGGAEPTTTWSRRATHFLAQVGLKDFKGALLRWLPLVERARTQPLQHPGAPVTDGDLTMTPGNADALKGLAWICSSLDDRELAAAIGRLAVSAYRRLPAGGARCVRLGNACVWALSQMPGSLGVKQLTRLKTKVRQPSVQKLVDGALSTATTRLGKRRPVILN